LTDEVTIDDDDLILLPCGNNMADSAANRGTRDGTPVVPAAPSRAGPAGPPAAPSVRLVKRADGESLKRDALELFALEHVLDQRDAKRRNTTTPSIRQIWATVARGGRGGSRYNAVVFS
jgi:hypothetical protein